MREFLSKPSPLRSDKCADKIISESLINAEGRINFIIVIDIAR